MRRAVTGFAVGAVLGALTCYLVLRAATQAYEDRVQRAESAADVERARADEALALADSLASQRPDTLRVPVPVTRTDVRTIVETLPDSQAVEELVRIVATRDTAVAERDTALRLADAEIGALRVSLRHLTAALDTARAALADRPSAMVTWDWTPRLGMEAFGRYETGSLCAGAGPSVTLWRIAVQGYGALCSEQVALQTTLEPRAGVMVTVTLF